MIHSRTYLRAPNAYSLRQLYIYIIIDSIHTLWEQETENLLLSSVFAVAEDNLDWNDLLYLGTWSKRIGRITQREP